MRTILTFVAFMLLGWLLLSLSGCTTGDVAVFSQTNGSSIASGPRILPRQMTWRDMVPSERRRK